jgi:ferredoxin
VTPITAPGACIGGRTWVHAGQIASWEAESMRVTVDSDKCQGHNRCYALAPDVFDVDDLGFAFVKIEGELPPELEDGARAGAANCPEYAITITE